MVDLRGCQRFARHGGLERQLRQLRHRQPTPRPGRLEGLGQRPDRRRTGQQRPSAQHTQLGRHRRRVRPGARVQRLHQRPLGLHRLAVRTHRHDRRLLLHPAQPVRRRRRNQQLVHPGRVRRSPEPGDQRPASAAARCPWSRASGSRSGSRSISRPTPRPSTTTTCCCTRVHGPKRSVAAARWPSAQWTCSPTARPRSTTTT